MNKKIKLFSTLLTILVLSIVSSNKIYASHAAGAEIIYIHQPQINDSTYQIIFKFYRDCTGISAPNTVPLCYFDSCNYTSGMNLTMSLMATFPGGSSGQNLNPGCPSFPTACNGGSLPGYQEYWYSVTVTLPERCTWTFKAEISARNTSNNMGGGNLATMAKLKNSVSLINSSPQFLVKPVPYMCVNQPFAFNNNAFDPNGDFMQFTSIAPMIGGSCGNNFPILNVTYINGFTPANPLPTTTGNPFNVNILNGQITFTPTATGKYGLAIKVDEFRNGQWIGYVMRDIQLQVISGCTSPPPIAIVDTGCVGCNLAGAYIRGCPNNLLNFCFTIYSPDTAVKFSGVSNSSTVIPGSIVTFGPQGGDTISGCFSWTPTVADTGLHTFTITVTDTSCRPPGIFIPHVKTYSIFIPPPVRAFGDTTICPNDFTTLWVDSMIVPDSMVWSVLSGDVNSLGCISCDTVIVNPSVKTTYIVHDYYSPCSNNFDTVVVDVLNPPTVDIGIDDTLICQGSLVSVIPTVTPSGNYSYSWSPTASISPSSNVANVSLFPFTDTKYYLTVTSSACTNMDSINIRVIPTDVHITTNDTAICIGESVQIKLGGTSKDSFTYTWTPTKWLNSSNVMEPLSTPDSTVTYFVSINRPGCNSYFDALNIQVQPYPVVDLGPDREICQWDTVHFQPEVLPKWFTNYTFNYSPKTNLSPQNGRNPVLTGYTAGSFTYLLSVNTSAGCTGTDDVNVEVHPGDFMEINPKDTTVCAKSEFTYDGSGADIYKWVHGMYLDDSTIASPTVKPATPIRYTVYGTSQFGCLDTAYLNIGLAPGAILEAGDPITIYDADEIKLITTGNCSFFNWSPNVFLDNNTVSNPLLSNVNSNVVYVIAGATEKGCITSDTLYVYYDKGKILEMPNAFTPGSSENSALTIIKRGIFNLEFYRIFDRWGNLLFETQDIKQGWDGTYKGEMQPMGTYVYSIQGKDKESKTIQKNGNILLIR